jgi:hypothetical protein
MSARLGLARPAGRVASPSLVVVGAVSYFEQGVEFVVDALTHKKDKEDAKKVIDGIFFDHWKGASWGRDPAYFATHTMCHKCHAIFCTLPTDDVAAPDTSETAPAVTHCDHIANKYLHKALIAAMAKRCNVPVGDFPELQKPKPRSRSPSPARSASPAPKDAKSANEAHTVHTDAASSSSTSSSTLQPPRSPRA